MEKNEISFLIKYIVVVIFIGISCYCMFQLLYMDSAPKQAVMVAAACYFAILARIVQAVKTGSVE